MSSLTERLSKIREKAAEQVKGASDYAEALRLSQDAEAMRQVRELAAAGDEEAKGLLVDIEQAKKAAEGSKPALAVQAAAALMSKLGADDRLQVSAVIREGLEGGALRECHVGETDSVSVYDLDLGQVVHATGAFGLTETRELVERIKAYIGDQREQLTKVLTDGKINVSWAAELAVELRMGKVHPWSWIEQKKAEASKAEAEGKKKGVPPHFRFTYQVDLESGKTERRDSAFVSWGRGEDSAYPSEKSFGFLGLLHTEAKRQVELVKERLPEFTLGEAEASESGSFSEILAGSVGEAVIKLETTWKVKDGEDQPIFVKVARESEKESVKVIKAWPEPAVRSLFRRPDGSLKPVSIDFKFLRGEDNRVVELSFEAVRDQRLRNSFQKRVSKEANMGVISEAREKKDAAYRVELAEFRRAIVARATISRDEFVKGSAGFVAICNDNWQIAPDKTIDLVDGLLQQDDHGNVSVVELSGVTRKLIFGGKTQGSVPRRQIAQENPRAWAWIMKAEAHQVAPPAESGNGETQATTNVSDQPTEPRVGANKSKSAYEAAVEAARPRTPRGKANKPRGDGRRRGFEPQDELEG